MRLEVVIALFSRFGRGVGVDAEWGIDSLGRSLLEETIFATGAGEAGIRVWGVVGLEVLWRGGVMGLDLLGLGAVSFCFLPAATRGDLSGVLWGVLFSSL